MIIKKRPYSTEWEFIDHITQVIDKQILSFSEKKLDKIFTKIHTVAKDKAFDELYIITRLLDHADERKSYYYSKQHRSYNYDVLKYIIRWFCILLVAGLLLHFVIVRYELPKCKELVGLIKKLETFGIIVKECSSGSGKMKSYYLDISAAKDVPKYISQYQYFVAKNLLEQAYQVHADIHGKVKWLLIIAFGFIFMAIQQLFDHIRSLFRPSYKQRFETWSFIEQRLGQVKEIVFEQKYFLNDKGRRKKNKCVSKNLYHHLV